MGRTQKYTMIEKVQACEDYISGKISAREIALSLKMTKHGYKAIYGWVQQYKKYGSSAFEKKLKNKAYSKAFKTEVVEAYLRGEGSNIKLALKYNIPSRSIIIKWVTIYTEGKQIKDYDPKPEVYMTKARKTTIEERKEIVEYCLNNNKDYKGTASLYNVNYAQVYSWVKKYLDDGEAALKDRRGKRKSEEELSDDEKKDRKILLLERKIKQIEKENELLKKLEELERRR